jgi:hypothetical protein
MTCHASANLGLAIPHWVPPVKDPTADNAANRGSAMHEMFAAVMELGATDMAKMAEAIDYVATLRRTRRFKVMIEQTFTATWLATNPQTTIDLGLYVADEIHVLDLKTGKIPVEVVDNEQLLFYAATVGRLAPKAKGVMVHILQPWANGNTSWFADTATIAAFMDKARRAEAAIAKGDTAFGPSDHCKFCPANPHGRGLKGKPLCPAMMSMLYPPIVDENEMLGL